jgi:hypothetical protein
MLHILVRVVIWWLFVQGGLAWLGALRRLLQGEFLAFALLLVCGYLTVLAGQWLQRKFLRPPLPRLKSN